MAFETIGNSLIEEIQVLSWDEYFQESRFERQACARSAARGRHRVEMIPIEEEDKTIDRMSRERCWALTSPK